MGHERLRIVNMPDASEWDKVKHLPRFMQPLEFSTTPCIHCPGNCCFGEVDLTMVEALRIGLTLSVPIGDVVEAVRMEEGSFAPGKTPLVPLLDGEYRLRLRKKKDFSCLFLISINGRGRCSIHGLRPGICRLFPFEVEVGRRRVVVGSQTMCPTRWLQDETARARVAVDLQRLDDDIGAEKKMLRAWKRRKGERGWKEFVLFAVDNLARYLGINVAAVTEPPRRRLGTRLW